MYWPFSQLFKSLFVVNLCKNVNTECRYEIYIYLYIYMGVYVHSRTMQLKLTVLSNLLCHPSTVNFTHTILYIRVLYK